MPSYRPHNIPEREWPTVKAAYDQGNHDDLVFLFNHYRVGTSQLCYCSSGRDVAKRALYTIFEYQSKLEGNDSRGNDKDAGKAAADGH
jgi:hypothetical protein